MGHSKSSSSPSPSPSPSPVPSSLAFNLSECSASSHLFLNRRKIHRFNLRTDFRSLRESGRNLTNRDVNRLRGNLKWNRVSRYTKYIRIEVLRAAVLRSTQGTNGQSFLVTALDMVCRRMRDGRGRAWGTFLTISWEMEDFKEAPIDNPTFDAAVASFCTWRAAVGMKKTASAEISTCNIIIVGVFVATQSPISSSAFWRNIPYIYIVKYSLWTLLRQLYVCMAFALTEP